MLFTLSACTDSKPQITPPGQDESTVTDALEIGAAVLQNNAPLTGMDVYLVGFHPMKADPDHQMEAHHFCRQVNEDFAQCALFDGNAADANLNGVEYIISERLFSTLPVEERQYWHPHNYEILSGQLIAPGIPDVAEEELMRRKMNSYGKTWHLWDTRDETGTTLPLGKPMLAWSFNRDGEAQPELLESRDARMNLNTGEKRRERAEFVDRAKPQYGVDELSGKFPRPTQDIPGVQEAEAAKSKGE
ncbi:OBAP family protein [Alteromonas pelagimontana]|uniref:OBAP family protein n=2 Tax=Alteromonas pelagimontana TaxID=1858656 RepID=A0A6M4MID3_9ALTE|nr:OBAP family protein [Alteromonas pelagimontana]